MQRLAVLTTALAQSPPDPELIYEAMKDRVHQPYRKTLVSVSSLCILLLVPRLPLFSADHHWHTLSHRSLACRRLRIISPHRHTPAC